MKEWPKSKSINYFRIPILNSIFNSPPYTPGQKISFGGLCEGLAGSGQNMISKKSFRLKDILDTSVYQQPKESLHSI
jgi:hypothetical protein